MIRVTVEHNGQRLVVPVLRAQGKLWFHWFGETHVIDLGGGSRRAGAERGKAHPGVCVAPMPGKITRVNAQKGDKVQRGQALIILEAMKMEYTLECDIDGVVTEANAQAGAQVALGDVLMKVSEA